MSRYAHNPNLFLHTGGRWNGLPVQTTCGPLIVSYLESILRVLNYATEEYSRVCGMRFDLRIPIDWPETPNAVITRFKKSLSAQIEADLSRRVGLGRRRIPCRLRYIWVRERKDSHHQHYHVVILVNRDAYFSLGSYLLDSASKCAGAFGGRSSGYGTSMAQRIQIAWARALGISEQNVAGLVFFPKNAVYSIDRNSPNFVADFEKLFQRLSYFAKADTKEYGNQSHNFGYSQG